MTERFPAVASKAERILSDVFGSPLHVGEGHDLGGSARSRVLRFPVVNRPDGAPASVIVKQCASETFDPDSADDAPWLFFNDWACLQFLGQITDAPPLVPTLYGEIARRDC